MADTALTAREFESLMAPFEPFEAQPALAIAVSGGRDSLALAVLARDWVTNRQGSVLALIVDHGLRAESPREAQATRTQLAALGIDAEILEWSGTKPTARVQQVARQARYRLLFGACRRHGILHLLVAHHADDQSETLVMRAARLSGADGLAGMAAAIEHRDARLLRPLLAVSRTRLTATLQAGGIGWIDDPSNEDRRFERVRVRQDRAAGPVARPAERAAREQRLARAALDVVAVEPDGIVLDQRAAAGLSNEITTSLLGRLVQAVAGRDYPPRRDRLARAAARLSQGPDRGRSGKSQDFTLSGCQFRLRQDPATRRLRWIVGSENGRRNEKKPGQPLVPAAFFACDAFGASHLD